MKKGRISIEIRRALHDIVGVLESYRCDSVDRKLRVERYGGCKSRGYGQKQMETVLLWRPH